ncbi:protein pxr-1-like [Melanotaenia boesemani]|uniref:protein pxr-1-like n=1 Tax=Melanotaenia boesemani TaxID=1250792 RepID=UPI001C055B20|nr:protein pxr-1-like [Melanotaenia boesemani]
MRMMMPEDSQTSGSEVKIKPQKKRKRDSAETQFENSLERLMPKKKKMKLDKDLVKAKTDSPKEAQNVASTNTKEDRPQRKRTRETFTGSSSPETSSSPRKRMRMMMPEDSQTSGSEVKIKHQKKRKRDSAETQFENRSPDTSSPERKKRKKGLLQASQQDPCEAASSEVTLKPRRKRTLGTFTVPQFESSSGHGSPERKRRKIGFLGVSQRDRCEAASSEVTVKPRRKRTLDDLTDAPRGSSSGSCWKRKKKKSG